MRRRLGRRAGTRAARRLRPGAHLPARQRQVEARAARGARRRRRPRRLDNLDDIDRLERLVAERGARAARAAARHARASPRHAPDDLHRQADSKFGFDLDDGARPRSSGCAPRDRLELEGLHMHIGSQILDLEPFRAALEALADARRLPLYNLGGGLGVAYTAPSSRRRSRTTSRRRSTPSHEVARARQAASLDEPGRALVANSTRHALHGAVGQAQRLDLGRRRRRHVRQPAADALRRALRGAGRRRASAAATRCHLAGKHCESGDVIVRDAELADPRPGDVLVTPGDRRLRLRDGQQLQRRAARRRCLLQGRRRARRRAARDLRGSARAPRRAEPGAVPRSACSATARSARRSRSCSSERADQIERDHRAAARDHRRADALARRLRRDPRAARDLSSS